jgi:proteic killer suppression protein
MSGETRREAAAVGGKLATSTGALDVVRTASYHPIVIRSFRSSETQAVFEGRFSKKFNQISAVAERKLNQIHAAARLSDLVIFPGNRLDALKRDRTGEYSIRVNDQYRICFEWRDGDAYEVEITDYH